MAAPSCRILNCQPPVGLGNGEGNPLGRGIPLNRKKSGTEVARLPVSDHPLKHRVLGCSDQAVGCVADNDIDPTQASKRLVDRRPYAGLAFGC